MEEEKAAAYYEELTRKGEGAARFKQGLGFSLSSPAAETDAFPVRGSALPSSSSSFLSQFVRASSPNSSSKLEKESEIQSIKEKLKKKPDDRTTGRSQRDLNKVESRVTRRSPNRDRDEQKRFSRRRSRSKSRSRIRERDVKDQINRRRNRSRSRERGDRDRRNRRRSKSRSRSRERGDRDRVHRRRSRSRSRSRDKHSDREREKVRFGHRDLRSQDQRKERRRTRGNEQESGKQDYSRLIEGYDQMSASERVKAKMKQQLAETADKDTTMGVGWERFEFDKDAPVDDEEVEAAEDDVALVKQIGQSFRFSAIEVKREEHIKAAHDEAMFGAPTRLEATTTEDNSETDISKNDCEGANAAASLLSDKVLAKQQGSWRDRARKV